MDLDGDTDLDVLVASSAPSTIRWYENLDGSGNFGPQRAIEGTTNSVHSVFPADLDSDTDLDVLFISASSSSQFSPQTAAGWIENLDGKGTFGNSRQFDPSPNQFYSDQSVVAADLDGDTDLDVLVGPLWFQNLDGQGTFGSPTYLPGTHNLLHITDIDGDMDNDILSMSNNDVSLCTNTDGAGNFNCIDVITAGGGFDLTQGLHVADIDGDNNPDLVVASDDKIRWYLNTDGAGTFGNFITIVDPFPGATSVIASPIDSDGDLDVIAASFDGNSVAWFENTDGAGTFGSPRTISASVPGAKSLFLGDIDGDTLSDVVVASYTADKLSWFKKLNGDGDFGGERIVVENPSSGPRSFHASDIDGDQDLDVVGAFEFENEIRWYENLDGGGDFAQTPRVAVQVTSPTVILPTDIDGDQDVDIVSDSNTANSAELGWYANENGLGIFGQRRPMGSEIIGEFNKPQFQSILSGDLDSDFDMDVVTLLETELENEIFVYENASGDGAVIQTNPIEGSDDIGIRDIRLANLDRDGDLDVVISKYSFDEINGVSWFRNLFGLGIFSTQQVVSQLFALVGDPNLPLAIADLDGDNDQDVLTNSGGDFYEGAGSPMIWYENSDGDGNFLGAQNISQEGIFALDASYVLAADLDEDGDLDTLSAYFEYGPDYEAIKVVWFENVDGRGDFGRERVIANPFNEIESLVSADLDRDGDEDLLATISAEDQVIWYENISIDAPDNVRAGGGGEGTIRLVWSRNVDPAIIGYNVYRSVTLNFHPNREELLNPAGLLEDPEFVDGLEAPLDPGSTWYYQIEAVGLVDGATLRTRSGTVAATEGEYQLFLPAIRATQSGGNGRTRYPISLLNARGIVEEGFQLTIGFPDFIENLSFETTALTEGFTTLQSEIDPSNRVFRIFSNPAKGPVTSDSLQGEGSLVNLVFDVRSDVAVGTIGMVTVDITRTEFGVSDGSTVIPNTGAPGTIEVQTPFRLGDVTGDGAVSFQDAILAASFSLGLPPTNDQFRAGDMNADGILDIADLNLIRFRSDAAKSAEESWTAKGGDEASFQIQLLDTTFSMIPGNIEVGIAMTPPLGTPRGIASAAMTITYSSPTLILTGVDLIPGIFSDLFYDQRDLSRFFKDGRVRVVASSPADHSVEGEFIRMRFKNKGQPTIFSTPIKFNPNSVKLSGITGGDEEWLFGIELIDGRIFFSEEPNLDLDPNGEIDSNDLLLVLFMVRRGDLRNEDLYRLSALWRR